MPRRDHAQCQVSSVPSWEQKIPGIAHDLFGASPRLGGASDYETTQAYITQANVSFSLRGGTREIVRGIIARGLGMR